MTPTIAITTLFTGEPEDENKLRLNDFSALNLVNFEFLPHFGAAGKKEKLKEYFKRTHHLIYACEDGEGIVISGKEVKFFGKINSFVRGKLFDISKLPRF